MSYDDDDYSSDDEVMPPVVSAHNEHCVQQFPRVVFGPDKGFELGAHEEIFKCVHCEEEFFTERELVRHKESKNDHDYCRIHDLDFESFDDYGRHRVNNRDHITCEHCYTDFKSTGGLEIHLRQNHKNEKSSICSGCKMVFKGGMAGLAMHLESNMCKGDTIRNPGAISVSKRQSSVGKWDLLKPSSENAVPQKVTQEASGNPKADVKKSGAKPKAQGSFEQKLVLKDVQKYWNEIHKAYVCHCGKKFNKNVSILQHLNSVSHSRQQYACVGCTKVFGSSSALLQHHESKVCPAQNVDVNSIYDLSTGSLTKTVREKKAA